MTDDKIGTRKRGRSQDKKVELQGGVIANLRMLDNNFT